jgi:basic membrane lipoprotein Med (substrate-binding protein (PBP1-ABC) superfamily)
VQALGRAQTASTSTALSPRAWTPSVEAAVLSAAKGTFKAGSYIGTLSNNGTGFAYDITTSAALKSTIAKIAQGIESGMISTDPNKYPAG